VEDGSAPGIRHRPTGNGGPSPDDTPPVDGRMRSPGAGMPTRIVRTRPAEKSEPAQAAESPCRASGGASGNGGPRPDDVPPSD
jgi:hypothetical protein